MSYEKIGTRLYRHLYLPYSFSYEKINKFNNKSIDIITKYYIENANSKTWIASDYKFIGEERYILKMRYPAYENLLRDFLEYIEQDNKNIENDNIIEIKNLRKYWSSILNE